jgi:TIR domain
MADIFISYSRRDSEFVGRLADALQARGKDVWVDIDDIRDAEEFPEALRAAVAESDGFVFVITPDSVESSFCDQEVAHALELGKRIIPLELRKVADQQIPDAIRVRNWIPVNTGRAFRPGVERLLEALEADLDHAKAHTRWTREAVEWDSAGRDKSFLLRGSELAAAEEWLRGAIGRDPTPTHLQRTYIAESRDAADSDGRSSNAVAAFAAGVCAGALATALVRRRR